MLSVAAKPRSPGLASALDAPVGGGVLSESVMLKNHQKDALRAFKTELRRKAQDERAAARRKAEALRSAQVKEAQVDAWAQALRGVTPLK